MFGGSTETTRRQRLRAIVTTAAAAQSDGVEIAFEKADEANGKRVCKTEQGSLRKQKTAYDCTLKGARRQNASPNQGGTTGILNALVPITGTGALFLYFFNISSP